MAAHPHPHQAPLLPRLGASLTDLLLALVAFAAALGLLAVGDSGLWDEGAATVAAALALLALSALPLVAARHEQLAIFVLTALAQSALALVATPAGPPIGPTVALFYLAESGDGSRAGMRLTLATVVAMLLVHGVAVGAADDRAFPAPELLFGALLWGTTWLAGDRTRLRRERIAELEDRARRAEREAERERELAAAEERTRIARDLHDSAGHAINVILVHAGAGRLHAETDPERAREAFGTIEEVARETVGEIDQMVGALRERGGEAGGVEPPAGLAALPALVERHRATGLTVELERDEEEQALPAAVDRAAYRIAQEALTNAARHGGGTARVEIEIGKSELLLCVTNPKWSSGRRTGGHGLVGMRERAEALGGSLEVEDSGPDFVLRARLPLGGRG